MKKKIICFAINSNEKANIIIREAKKSNIFPIIFIKYYITKGLGAEWILGLKKTLSKSFSKNSFKLYVDVKNDYGLCFELIKMKVDFIKLNSNSLIFKKINQIAKKNKVLINPTFNILDLSKIKNISRRISKL